jgi:hypothetical protein
MEIICYMRAADGTITTTTDVRIWARWLEANDSTRRIRETTIGESWISTVFLGIDHNVCESIFEYTHPTPLIFETMVFGGVLDDERDRYATEAEAIAGHEAMVERVKQHEG